MNWNNLTLVEHFRSNDHDLNKDVKFPTIERIEKDVNIKSTIKNKKREIVKTSENIPEKFGFYMKFNHLALK